MHAHGRGHTEPYVASERRGPCPVEGTSFELNSVIELELRDRVVGSGSAQQAMLSAGPDPENPPIQAFGQNFYTKRSRGSRSMIDNAVTHLEERTTSHGKSYVAAQGMSFRAPPVRRDDFGGATNVACSLCQFLRSSVVCTLHI